MESPEKFCEDFLCSHTPTKAPSMRYPFLSLSMGDISNVPCQMQQALELVILAQLRVQLE